MWCRIFDYLHGEGDGIRAKNNQMIRQCIYVMSNGLQHQNAQMFQQNFCADQN